MSLRSSSPQPSGMSNAIGSSRESNPLRRICHLCVVPFGNVADGSMQFVLGVRGENVIQESKPPTLVISRAANSINF